MSIRTPQLKFSPLPYLIAIQYIRTMLETHPQMLANSLGVPYISTHSHCLQSSQGTSIHAYTTTSDSIVPQVLFNDTLSCSEQIRLRKFRKLLPTVY